MPSAAGAAYLMLAAASGGAAAQVVVLTQLANLAKALHDMHQAEGASRRAQAIETAVRTQLVTVSKKLAEAELKETAAGVVVLEPDAADAVRRARTGQAPATQAPGSPLPNPLPEARPRTTPGAPTGPARSPERGPER